MKISRNVLLLTYRQRIRVGFWVGCSVAAFVLVLWAGNLFTQIQLRLNDIYFVPSPTTGTVVIVALDDASHEQFGRSLAQWSRSIYADLVRMVSAGGARVIAFDVLFSEKTASDDLLAAAIQEARSSEQRTRFVMPFIGLDLLPASPSQTPSLQFKTTLQPDSAFRDVVDYLGNVNTFGDVDGTVRRQPSLIQTDQGMAFSFPVTAYLAYLRIPAAAASQVVTSHEDQLQLTTKSIPVDAHGLWRPYYFGPPARSDAQTFPVLSASEVIAGNVAPEIFKDKIVLIGVMNRIGGTDLYLVPSSFNGQMMAGVEIHAHSIESLIQGAFPTEQSRLSQVMMIVLLSICASILYANLRWYWTLPAAGALVTGWIIFVLVTFSTRLQIINLLHSGLALTIPVIAILARDISAENRRRRTAEFLLKSVVQVSHQRLIIDRIFPSLAEDIQRVVGAPSGAIWLADSEPGVMSYQWNLHPEMLPQFEAIGQRTKQEQRLVTMSGLAAAPVRWQQHLIAVIAIQKPNQRLGVRAALRLFEALAEQVAPGLESAILYTQTQRQNNLLETILAGSPAAIAVTDAEMRVTRMNPALREALSAPDPATPGGFLMSLLEAAGVAEDIRNDLQRDFRTGHPFRKDLTIDKQAFTFDAAPLDSGGWVVILNDVSTLVELSELKTQMLRMASHDLKKPLSRILGYGSLILDATETDTFSEQQLQYLKRMFQAGEEMTGIINQVLNMEQLRSRKIQRAPVDMAPIVHDVIERHSPDIRSKNQILNIKIGDDLPKVFGDPYLLLQIITNLIENAVKYTGDGGSITVRLFGQGSSIRFEVEDTGCGIPEHALQKIFQDFYRVRTPATAHISGTGLGLGLAKSLVESHGGCIGVTSKEGVGSTFYVELPVAAS